jgi:hypothetical protein
VTTAWSSRRDNSNLGVLSRDRSRLHPTGQTGRKRIHCIIQRPPPGGVLEPELVSRSIRRTGRPGGLESGLSCESSSHVARWSGTSRVCRSTVGRSRARGGSLNREFLNMRGPDFGGASTQLIPHITRGTNMRRRSSLVGWDWKTGRLWPQEDFASV